MNFREMTIADLKDYLDGRETLSEAELMGLREDGRKGTLALLERYAKRQEKLRQEETRLFGLLKEERHCRDKGFKLIAGVDEAGRGPLAGPVLAAAVILPPHAILAGINDSKKLSPEKRMKLFDQIVETAESSAIASASRDEIDRLNIHAASMLAMNRALQKLSCQPDFVLVDGFPIRSCAYKQKAIKGGDSLSMSIAAASILAKVTRDRIMLELHRRYPQYGFHRNKGYGTADHLDAIRSHGPCSEHRRSFTLPQLNS